MFKATGKGFHITFANGWTVSVQFGSGNYCENRDYRIERYGTEGEKGESVDAEIAAWDASGKWYDMGSDTVKGWCSPDEVGTFIATVQAL